MEGGDAALGLLIGGILAVVVGFIKSTVPELPGRFVPLVVLAIATVIVVVGAISGEIKDATILGSVALVVEQTAVAMGLRSGLQNFGGDKQLPGALSHRLRNGSGDGGD